MDNFTKISFINGIKIKKIGTEGVLWKKKYK